MSENRRNADCFKVVPTGKFRVRFVYGGATRRDVKLWPDHHAAYKRVEEFKRAGASNAWYETMYRLPDGRELSSEELPAGAFQWEEFDPAFPNRRHLYIVLPGGEGSFDAIQVVKGPPGGNRVWGWDGNEERPTIHPSIHWVGVWHGFLRAGKLESC